MENRNMMAQQFHGQNVPSNDSANGMPKSNAGWISGRIETLLSHYFQPDNPVEVFEGALDDWVATLEKYPQDAIEHACNFWVRNYQSKRPTPASISNIALNYRQQERRRQAPDGVDGPARGNRSDLSFDELEALEKILETARSFMNLKQNGFGDIVFARRNLAEHGAQTLAYWNEPLPDGIPQHLLDTL